MSDLEACVANGRNIHITLKYTRNAEMINGLRVNDAPRAKSISHVILKRRILMRRNVGDIKSAELGKNVRNFLSDAYEGLLNDLEKSSQKFRDKQAISDNDHALKLLCDGKSKGVQKCFEFSVVVGRFAAYPGRLNDNAISIVSNEGTASYLGILVVTASVDEE